MAASDNENVSSSNARTRIFDLNFKFNSFEEYTRLFQAHPTLSHQGYFPFEAAYIGQPVFLSRNRQP
nr:MAG TPA: hypothetical protein [Caudoviricetes sp.]